MLNLSRIAFHLTFIFGANKMNEKKLIYQLPLVSFITLLATFFAFSLMMAITCSASDLKGTMNEMIKASLEVNTNCATATSAITSIAPASVSSSSSSLSTSAAPAYTIAELSKNGFENLAIQLFPSEYNGKTGAVEASIELAKDYMSKYIPASLGQKQYSWSTWNGGPHITLGFVQKVPKALVSKFISFFNDRLNKDIENFIFTVDDVAFLKGTFSPTTDDGKLLTNYNWVIKPNKETTLRAQFINNKIIQLTQQFRDEILGKEAPNDWIIVDKETNGPGKFHPHITLWDNYKPRVEQLEMAAAEVDWKFNKAYIERKHGGGIQVTGKVLHLNALVIE